MHYTQQGTTMSLALVSSNSSLNTLRSTYKRKANPEAREMLFKGFFRSLNWGAAIDGVANTILGCEVDELLNPNFYFANDMTLRDAVDNMLNLSWSDWVKKIDAHLYVTRFNHYHPEDYSIVLKAVDNIRKNDDLNLTGQSFAGEVARLVAERGALELQVIDKPTIERAIDHLTEDKAVITDETSHNDIQEKEESIINEQPPATIKPEPITHIQPMSISDAITIEELRRYKSAFRALNMRAQKKIKQKNNLIVKTIKCLNFVSDDRDRLVNSVTRYHASALFVFVLLSGGGLILI